MIHKDVSGIENILVIGAGELGMAVLKHLLPKVSGLGGNITVLVSPNSLNKAGLPTTSSRKELASKGATFAAVDIGTISHEKLVDYFVGFTTVINCTGFVAGQGIQTRITLAVLEANVQRYFPWQFGVDYDIVGKGSGQPVFDEQFEVREMLRNQNDTDWIIISTGMFTSFLFEPAFDVVNISEGYINALGSGNTKVTVTTPDDIGKLTVSILLATPKFANEIILVAGDTVSYDELADIVDKVTGKNLERRVLELASLHEELAKTPDDQMLRYRAAFALGDGMWWDKKSTYNYRNDIETQNIKQWLSQNWTKMLALPEQ